jgi:hypothetical protein
MSRCLGDRGSVRALDPDDLAQQFSVVDIDNHDPVLPGDEHAVMRRVGNNVVPTPLAAQ